MGDRPDRVSSPVEIVQTFLADWEGKAVRAQDVAWIRWALRELVARVERVRKIAPAFETVAIGADVERLLAVVGVA